MGKLEIFGVIVMGIMLIGIGWLAGDIYNDVNQKIQIRGLWFNNFQNYSDVQEYAYNQDHSGEWVCINVNKDLTFEDIVETCTHEASHELFARKCTEQPEECIKLMETIDHE